MDTTSLGAYLANKRQEKNLSQRELAKKASLSFATVQAIENGDTKSPGIQAVLSIAKALNAHPMELIAAYEGKSFDPRKVPVEEQNAALLDAFREFLDTQKGQK